MCIPSGIWFGILLGGLMASMAWGIYWHYQHAWCRHCLVHVLFVVQQHHKRGLFLSIDDKAAVALAIKHLIKTQ